MGNFYYVEGVYDKNVLEYCQELIDTIRKGLALLVSKIKNTLTNIVTDRTDLKIKVRRMSLLKARVLSNSSDLGIIASSFICLIAHQKYYPSGLRRNFW